MTEIATQLSAVGYHRQEAMHYADQADELAGEIGPEGNGNRELNQRIGVALKLADVHARLALAMAGFRA